jgi:four helix bundle protein
VYHQTGNQATLPRRSTNNNCATDPTRFNLGDQLRRAAISIVSNIAEGSRRIHKKEKRQFYTVAYGSASEIEAQLMIIEDLKMAPTELLKKTQEELQSVLRLTNRLLNVFR